MLEIKSAKFDNSEDMSAPVFHTDKSLIHRVQKYLENNESQTYVDITIMANDLQKIYKEYEKRKSGPFRSNVKKAYTAVLQNFGHSQDNLSSSEEYSDESSPELNYDNQSNQLIDIYKRNSKGIQESEAPIDISSDDSNDTTAAVSLTRAKTSNGASASHKPETVVIQPRSLIAPEIKPATEFASIDNSEPSIKRGKKRKINEAAIEPFVGTKKRKSSIGIITNCTDAFRNIGGLNNILPKIYDLLFHFKKKYVESTRNGILLHGPTGCGKTLLARHLAGKFKISLNEVQGSDLIGGIAGETEERINSIFEEAAASAPCILFIDGIDSLFQNKKSAQTNIESRVVAQLCNSIDYLMQKGQEQKVMLIAAANSVDLIDPALLRRFSQKFSIGIPNEEARIHILKILFKDFPSLSPDFDYKLVAHNTPGFSGADLLSLQDEALNRIRRRDIIHIIKEEYIAANILKESSKPVVEQNLIKSPESNNVDHEMSTGEVDVVETPVSNDIVVIEDDIKMDKIINSEEYKDFIQSLQNNDVYLKEFDKVLDSKIHPINSVITTEDVVDSIKNVIPVCKYEGFATVPDVSWDDIGSLLNIRKQLQLSILGSTKYSKFNVCLSNGILLYGPPGCGKTLLAKAIANEAGINFLSVSVPELLNMCESEKGIRSCFERARNSAPCILFFDEIDALCPSRSSTDQDKATDRVINQMLIEMDGLKGRRGGIFLLGTTNLIEKLDPALLRLGRFTEIIYVPPPTTNDRASILKAIVKNPVVKALLASDLDLDEVAALENCDRFSGADLQQLVTMANRCAYEEAIEKDIPEDSAFTTMEHFKQALEKIRPSLSNEDLERYEEYRKKYCL